MVGLELLAEIHKEHIMGYHSPALKALWDHSPGTRADTEAGIGGVAADTVGSLCP